MAVADHARDRGCDGRIESTRRSAKPHHPDIAGREVGFITGQLATEFLVVPELWRGFEHGELARSLASDRGFEVITVDLATPPGPVSFDCRAQTLMPSRARGANSQWIYDSSGTTAAPKGIRHTDATVIAGSRGMVDAMGITSSDIDPIAFPISHIGGAALVAAALMTGMRLVLFDAFDPAARDAAGHRGAPADLPGYGDAVLRGVPGCPTGPW